MNNELYIGSTIDSRNNIFLSIKKLNKIGCNFCQMFLSCPTKYKQEKCSDEALNMIKNVLIENNVKVVVHASFMLNFCNPCDNFKHKSAVKLLINDLKNSVKIGAIGVVIHMGKRLKMNKDVAIENYVKGIKNVLKNTPKESIIIFETGAGQGTEVCTDIESLGKLYHMFTEEEKLRIKICIDTCHVFSAGYDIGNEEYVDTFCELIENNLGWNNVLCIHLNDSKCEVNCKKDRHADISKGYIDTIGLKKFVKFCYQKNIPMVLETPCDTDISNKQQINLVKSWIAADTN